MTKSQKIQKYFDQGAKLSMKNKSYRNQVLSVANWFIKEDLGKRGDITSSQVVSREKKAYARVIAKEAGILAGLEETTALLKKINIAFAANAKDGQQVKKNTLLMKLSGNARDILLAERTILNMLGRMSGIATKTHKMTAKVSNRCLVCPTRKTQWGLLDKKAVSVGGGGTHRLGLYDFILIKENHLAIMDGTLSEKKLPGFWEVEVENISEAHKVAALNPGAILFDNMSPTQIKRVVASLPQNIIFEASGGIDEKTIAQYSRSGVDIVSLGALTHSVSALDVSLHIDTSY